MCAEIQIFFKIKVQQWILKHVYGSKVLSTVGSEFFLRWWLSLVYKWIYSRSVSYEQHSHLYTELIQCKICANIVSVASPTVFFFLLSSNSYHRSNWYYLCLQRKGLFHDWGTSLSSLPEVGVCGSTISSFFLPSFYQFL